jgi:hypothetical protein
LAILFYVIIGYSIVGITTKLVPKPLCISIQVRPSGKEFIKTINLWLFSGTFPLECVHSELLEDFQWKLVNLSGWEWCMVES